MNLNKASWEEEFKLTYYQEDILCDFNDHISICTARATGKTVSLSSMLTWMLVFNVYAGDYIVYTVPSKVHLQPVWNNLIRMWRSNSFLRELLPYNGGFNSSSYEVNVKTGGSLICRIAGMTGTGANVIGLHTPVVLLDEGGYYPWGTWIELQPIVNTFTQGYKVITAGVPTGIREKNVLYTTDQEDSSYTKHRVSAFENPRFTHDDNEHAKEQYGGVDNDDYIHLVLGEHGSPVFAIFDRNLMDLQSYPVYKMFLSGIDLREDMAEYISRLALVPAIDRKGFVGMGIDLGYTDPTAIVIFTEDSNGRLKFHARIQLTKVSYNLQDKIIDYLDSKFNPHFIAVDQGSAGIAVIQRLQESDEFLHKDYKKRIIPINFSSWIQLGFDSDGKEVKSKAKPFAVSVLQEYATNHKFVFSTMDLELVTELERMTYSKTPSGDITYKTLTARGGKRGDDHFTSALLCGAMGYYLENEYLDPRKRTAKLFAPRWIPT